jgi:hypothetical protein
MELGDFKEEAVSGVISLAIGVSATYAVSYLLPTQNLQWALTAVGFASFFSGFFSSYYVKNQD